jgi:flavodoxin
VGASRNGKERAVNAIVVYESVYGNTRAIAEAVAQGLGGARTMSVAEAGGTSDGADLIVVGGPTHMHGLSTKSSRHMAVNAAHEDGKTHVEDGADQEPGLRGWLHDLPDANGVRAAAFDTRLDKSPWLTGVAAHGIARRLRHHGYQVVGSESFLVQDSEGPLEDGEIERARAWGAKLADEIALGESGSQQASAA